MQDVADGNGGKFQIVIDTLQAIKAGIDALNAVKNKVGEVAHEFNPTDSETTAGRALRGRGAWGFLNPVGALGGAVGAW